MIMLLLNVLYLILHMASSSQHETIVPLMPNVLVVKVDRKVFTETQVPLRCGDYQDTEVIWWNGEERLENKGNQINVTVIEMMGGNYSCHNPAGDYLNHTLVLVQDIPSLNRTRRVLEKSHDTDKDEYIRCLAKNYSGIFHCSWKKTEYRMSAAAVFVQVGRTISCSVDSDGEGLTCQDRESCPFAEELSRIHLTVYFRTNYLLEDYTITPFYIQEIVKPDKIDITKVEGNTFQWGYPATWSRPCSYFPLTFRVKVVQHEASCDSKEKVFISETNINATEFTVRSSYKKYCFCLGAKDDLVDSQWSQWTRHEVKNKSKKH